MSDKNIEIMKKIIQEKNEKCSQQGAILRPKKSIGGSRKAKKNIKQGGVFDK